MPKPEPRWHPIRMLPTVAHHVTGMLEASRDQLELLGQAREKPYVLDDATVDRVIASFTAQGEDLWVFAEQVRRWQQEDLSPARRREVDTLGQQVEQLQATNTAVLELAEELSKGTIDKVLAKSDLELGLEALMRGLPGDR